MFTLKNAPVPGRVVPLRRPYLQTVPIAGMRLPIRRFLHMAFPELAIFKLTRRKLSFQFELLRWAQHHFQFACPFIRDRFTDSFRYKMARFPLRVPLTGKIYRLRHQIQGLRHVYAARVALSYPGRTFDRHAPLLFNGRLHHLDPDLRKLLHIRSDLLTSISFGGGASHVPFAIAKKVVSQRHDIWPARIAVRNRKLALATARVRSRKLDIGSPRRRPRKFVLPKIGRKKIDHRAFARLEPKIQVQQAPAELLLAAAINAGEMLEPRPVKIRPIDINSLLIYALSHSTKP